MAFALKRKRGTAFTEADLAGWWGPFETGFDLFGELLPDGTAHMCGHLVTCICRTPYWSAPIPPDLFERRWRELGPEYMRRRAPGGPPPRALELFGPP